MQTAVKFFDLPAKGSIGVVDKIAIKLSGGNNTELEPTDMQFMEVMGALMQIAPEQMEASFEQLDWVPLEGEGNGYVPLIDLTNGQDLGSGILNLLLGNAPETESIAPTSADQFVNNVSDPASIDANALVLNEVGEPVSSKADQTAPGNEAEEASIKAGQPVPNKTSDLSSNKAIEPAMNENGPRSADFKPASEPTVFLDDPEEGAVKTDGALTVKSGPGPNKDDINPAHQKIDLPLPISAQDVSAETEELHTGRPTETKTEMARFLANQGSPDPGGSSDQGTEASFGKTVVLKNQDPEDPAGKFKISGND